MSSINYPIVFDENTPQTRSAPSSTPSTYAPKAPSFRLTRTGKAGHESFDFVLAEIDGWPEAKEEMVTRCVDLGWPLGRACADVPQFFQRTCKKRVYVRVFYPAGVLEDVRECVLGAGLASAAAAVISSPAAAGAAFEVALKGCLAAKGAAWANEITATADTDSVCGDWH
jgi:hypothetical protein